MAGFLVAVAVLLCAGSARAATYGASSFTGSAEGWTVKSATCTVPVLCTAAGGYDGTAGNPPGSFTANSTVLVNVGGLFKTTVVAESPDFKAAEGGRGTLDLQRQFVPGALLALAPNATYSAVLVDRTSGAEAKGVTETLTAESPFTGKSGSVALVAGHTYAIKITAETSSTLIGLSLGTASLRFDNVSVTSNRSDNGGGGSGGGGGGGGAGGDGSSGALTDRSLFSLLQSSSNLGSSATMKGKRVFVKAKCPAKVGRACKITVQGMLKKGKPATTKRTAKVGKGKAKQLVLKVKPAVKRKVMNRKRLLFKENVRAGSAQATAYKRLKLMRR